MKHRSSTVRQVLMATTILAVIFSVSIWKSRSSWMATERVESPTEQSPQSVPIVGKKGSVDTPNGVEVSVASSPKVGRDAVVGKDMGVRRTGRIVEKASVPESGTRPLSTGYALARQATVEGLSVSQSEQTDMYAGARIVDEKTGHPDASGRYERVRVYETAMKYPFIRVVDTLQTEDGHVAGSKRIRMNADGTLRAEDRLVQRVEMVADHVTVKVKDGVEATDLAAVVAAHGGTILRRLRVPGPGVYLVQLPDAKVDAIASALTNLAQEPGVVATAHPDYVVHTCETIPNDPMFGQLWGMKNSGQIPVTASIVAGSDVLSGIGMQYSPATPPEGITGTLFDCGDGGSDQFPAGQNGYIALIERGGVGTNGPMTFAEKANNAKSAGAVAAIVYNNVPGEFSGSLNAPGDWIPTMSVSDETGANLKGRTNQTLTVKLLAAETPGDIRATVAWDKSTGSRSTLVGIIDTGVDYDHEDLMDNMWVNLGETGVDSNGHDKRTNGMDDDGNGYIDDWHGWDFCNNDNDPMDDHYHGTHCAGTIGGVGDNLTGVAGVCWKVSLVGLKFLNKSGSGYNSDAIEAVYYATRIGVKLTSNSWGGGAYDPTLREAIANAAESNILFVAAAGNAGTDNDSVPNYPSSFDCANIIAVAATDSGDQKAAFSCFGATTVDLGAPGVGILSCQPGNKYQLLNGTSMATPHVAGACALLWSRAPTWSQTQVKNATLSAVDPIPSLSGACVTGGRLNVAKFRTDNVALVGWSFDDSPGNNNGVVNPGETVNLVLTFKNLKTNEATNAHASLAILRNGTILTGEANLGTLAPGGSVSRTFQVNVAGGIAVPNTVNLRVTVTDDEGGNWQFPLALDVHLACTVNGTVTKDGMAAAGVTIFLDGPVRRTVVTDAQGEYSANVIEGVYSMSATNGDWLPALATTVVTTSVTSVNLAFVTATISGTVRDEATLTPVQGATVTVSGPYAKSAQTDSSGAYSLMKVYGRTVAVTVVATKPGTNLASKPRNVTVPPNAPGTDFLIGAPRIGFQPASLAIEAVLPETTNAVFKVSNRATGELKWTLRSQTAPIPELAEHAGMQLRSWTIGTNYISGYQSIMGAAYDGGGLWVHEMFNVYRRNPILHRLNPENGQRMESIEALVSCSNAVVQGMACDGTNLWFAAKANGTTEQMHIYVVDSSDGSLVKRLPVPTNVYPNALALGGGTVWLYEEVFISESTSSNRVYALDPDDGTLRKSFDLTPTLGATKRLSGMVYFNGALWTTIQDLRGIVRPTVLYRLNPVDCTVISQLEDVTPQNVIGALATDGTRRLWLVEQTGCYMGKDQPIGGHRTYEVDSGEANWIRAIPDHGGLFASSTQSVTVTCDSAVVGPGEHRATLVVESNDSTQPTTTADVVFVVSSPIEISGHVSLDGQPLSDAVIRYQGPYPGVVLSDAQGNYTFDAGTGTYTLVASKGDYVPSASVTVTVGPSTSGVDFVFTTGVVSGTARDASSGAPVGGATISYSGSVTGSVQTVSDGSYAITRVFGQTGALSIVASKTGTYADTDPQVVNVPPNRGGVDFAMGNPCIEVTPVSIHVEVPIRTVTNVPMSVANTGSVPLVWSTWAGYSSNGGMGVVRRTQTLSHVAPALCGIAFDGTSLWVNNNEPRLHRLDPNNGNYLGFTTIELSGGLFGSAWDGSNLWVAGRSAKKLYTVNRQTGAILKSLPAPYGVEPSGIAYGDGALWVLPWYDNNLNLDYRTIYKVDPSDGTPLAAIDIPYSLTSASLYGLAYHAGALWVSEFRSLSDLIQTARVFKLDPADGHVLASFLAPDAQTIGLAPDLGASLWMVNNNWQADTKAYLVESGSVNWLRPVPSSGRVPAGGTTTVSLAIDVNHLAKGSYTSYLHVVSNDRLRPDVAVPVTIDVIAATLIEVETTSVNVPEGGTNVFRVKLSKAPLANVTVTVARTEGDENIAVQSGSQLTFTTGNWNIYQMVVLAAAEDGDTADDAATFACMAPGSEDVIVTATEADNDTVLRIVAGAGGSVSPAGNMVVTKGQSVTIAATSNVGRQFWRWFAMEGTAIVGDPIAATTTVSITEPATIRANFSTANHPPTIVRACGDNKYGQIGDGTKQDRLVPVNALGISDVVAVAAGYAHTVAVKTNGTVWSWGYNVFGQLGDGTTQDRSNAVQVVGVTGVGAVTAGLYHTVTLKNDGTVWTWGGNDYGQLGDGTTTTRLTPVQTKDVSNVVAVAAGMYHTLALKSDGTVWAWGYNNNGQLGDNTTTPRSRPVQVLGLSNVTTIAASLFSVARKNDGTVWAWGGNLNGELGDGTFTKRLTPVQTKGVSNVVAVAAGSYHAVACRNDGAVLTWGYNNYGQLGDGTTQTRSNAVQVVGVTGVGAVAAGRDHTVTLKNDGTIWVWGGNNEGQLGIGTKNPRLAPTRVSNETGGIGISAGWFHTIMLCVRLVEPVAQTETIRVPEGGKATFGVKLDASPTGQLVVAVARLSGDTDIVVLFGSELTFTPENWDAYQTVTLVAAEDTDTSNGEAVIACSVDGQIQLTLTAIEADLNRDSDGDGMNDADEIRCGTDPDNSASLFTFYSTVMSNDHERFILRWQSATDQTYTVKAATNLIHGFGLLIATNIAATPPINVYTDTVEGVSQKFYRIMVE